MNEERRYDEQEIAAIFERAAEAQKAAQRNLSQEGLTLAELQEIGAEAGITPEFIAQAATTINHTTVSRPPITYFGVPIGVARSVVLPRPLSDEEWERLVVDLRETFHAHGKVGRDGSLRQWTNGNLKALVEPTTSGGYRLRLETRSDDLTMRLSFGTIMAAMMLFFTLIVLLKDPVSFSKLATIGMMSLIAASVAGYAAFYKAPRWSRTRATQMEAIIKRVTQMTATPPSEIAQGAAPQMDLDALPDQEETMQQLRVHDRI